MFTPTELVTDHAVLSVVIGPRAYGLGTYETDSDRHTVYAAPTSAWWGFDKPPAQVDGPEPGRLSWELERFLQLALANDPLVLECLWSPIVESHDTIGAELIRLRSRFISRSAYRMFLRYANAQFDRLSTPRSARDWDSAMHMLRVLLSLRHLLSTGEPLMDFAAYRSQLLLVHRGEADWGSVRAWRDQIAQKVESAYSTTRLPLRGDRTAAERFLIEVRRIRL
ncbi:hypothetical protein FB566_5112 [Stackebrandtia endophytica]|uniref:Nucleotidyltransferase n=1 Tax=Stackebrandtia endophytica TaxID=1496996 RepID=A0A543B3Y5_9ACTN|nr:nucleotidyltransferase domain-containing protein [Stackebrandtia endophytica]TQL79503.1 hypothetical protein FB566_5112 [Stackebrandtia endophytica]